MSNEEKLVRMLKYVSEHNDFYKKRIKEYGITNPLDITQWPILTRKELQENRYNMFSDGYKSKYFNQQLRRQSSSGSTGMPVNVYWDYKDWYASNMALWRKRLKWYNIHPQDKYVMFTLNAFNVRNDGATVYYVKESDNGLSINASMIQNESGYDRIVEIINDYDPKWMYIQPFILNRLIQAYERTNNNPPKSLRYIESVGELLASDLRKKTISFFKVPLANMYGSEEMNGIAYENPDSRMHILADNVYIEVKKEEVIRFNGEGESIITNLNNYAMPLIRYNQGDIINKDICGNLQYVKEIKGRSSQCISIDGGIEISSLLLQEVISQVNNQYDDIIHEYRFFYDKNNKKLRCFIKIINEKDKWADIVFKRLYEVLSEKTNSFIPFTCEVIDMKDDLISLKNAILIIE